jgi:fumarate hydratase class I
MPEFRYAATFQKQGPDTTRYRLVAREGVEPVSLGGEVFLRVAPEALTELARNAFVDVAHLLRTSHLESLANIVRDPESSANDRLMATELLQNAIIAAERVFPGCQDTGTAAVHGVRGDRVLVDGDDGLALSRGVYEAYQQANLRYSQLAPLDMWKEKNTGTNLPAQLDLLAGKGARYDFMFVAKGGGSANKFLLFHETKALLNPTSLREFLWQKIHTLGTAACPPYHLAIVIGGLSAEQTMKTVKLLSTGYYDRLPETGDETGRAFRDRALEREVWELTKQTGIGAQFGGKWFCHDVRVVRLPRHGASCPVGMGVSCSADRNAFAYIDESGVWLEQFEEHPARLLPAIADGPGAGGVHIDLRQPMAAIRQALTQRKVGDVVLLDGPMVVARDMAHARLKDQLDRTGDLPQWFKDHPVYYAGPAKTPDGFPSGSFGPTTAQRMDPYVGAFQAKGASMVMLAKGNRAASVTEACKQHGGFYLGSPGGPAARLGKECIKKVEVLDYEELGMEAVFRIEVENFPAWVVTDDKGDDFFAKFRSPKALVEIGTRGSG